MQTEGVWAASGWYYEGKYALLVYRWAEKRYPASRTTQDDV